MDLLLKIDILQPGNDNSTATNLLKDWKFIEISENFLKLKLLFVDEILVSSTSEYDWVQIVFMQPGFFFSQKGLSLNAKEPLS